LSVLVVQHLLGQYGPKALDRPAHDLAVGELRVDDPAGVVDGDQLADRELARGGVDLDHGGVAAGGEYEL
jgi:hypothetical protein